MVHSCKHVGRESGLATVPHTPAKPDLAVIRPVQDWSVMVMSSKENGALELPAPVIVTVPVLSV